MKFYLNEHIKKEANKAIKSVWTEHQPGGNKKVVIKALYDFYNIYTESHIKALFYVYMFGKIDGKLCEQDRNSWNEKAMFHNVKSFLYQTDKEHQSFKDFDNWLDNLRKELDYYD